MRQVSTARARTLRARGKIVRRHHAPATCTRHMSVFGHDAPAVDTHELTNRSQADTAADEWVMVPLCRGCHDWVGQHLVEAEAAGWRIPGWKYRQNQTTETEDVSLGDVVSSYTMPRPPSDRKPITVKISTKGIESIDARAAEYPADERVDRSEMVRRMLTYAEQHMPHPRQARPAPKPSQR